MDTSKTLAILEAEIKTLNDLLELLHAQQHAMMHGELDTMTDVVPKEEMVVARLKALELRRLKETAHQEDSGIQSIEEARSTLRDLVEQVQNVNRQNNMLMLRSLSLIRQQLILIIGIDETSELYTENGNSTTPIRRQLLNTKV